MRITQKIYKGNHYPRRLIPDFFKYFGFTRKNKIYTFKRKYTFNDDCRYFIEGEDQMDWSKLYGTFFGLLGIHRDSIRFGWRYNPKTEKIEIARIIYEGKKHTMEYLKSVNTNEQHEYSIVYCIKDGKLSVEFHIDEDKWDVTISKPKCRMHYGSGFYFGGNQVAPQDVSIIIE